MIYKNSRIIINFQGGRWTGKPGNDREFKKNFNKKRFLIVLNVLHKVIMHFEIPALFVQTEQAT